MDRNEARASLRVLVEVARADGKLAGDQKRLLDVVAIHEYEDDDPPESRFDDGRDFARALATIRSEEVRELTWKASLTLATLDGKCTTQEHAVLTRIHEALVPDEPLEAVVEAEQEYVERVDEIRETMDRATLDFLHQMSSASGGGKLSQSEYEQLVSRLALKKRELYAEALSLPPPRR
jgi:tellurite resistance protein